MDQELTREYRETPHTPVSDALLSLVALQIEIAEMQERQAKLQRAIIRLSGEISTATKTVEQQNIRHRRAA